MFSAICNIRKLIRKLEDITGNKTERVFCYIKTCLKDNANEIDKSTSWRNTLFIAFESDDEQKRISYFNLRRKHFIISFIIILMSINWNSRGM